MYLHIVNAISVRWFCTICADNYAAGNINALDEFSTCAICYPNKNFLTIKEKNQSPNENELEKFFMKFKRSRYW